MIPVYCPLCCDQPFDDQDGLFHHLRSLRNNLFCPICSERFSSFDHLVTHLSRKCYGPVSPREAKRKCLLNRTNLSDTLEGLPLESSINSHSGNTQGVPIESSSATIPETSGASVPSEIPPEIRNKLPRGVTLSLGLSETQLQPQKPSSFLSKNNKSSTKSSEKTNNLSVVLNKVSINPNVEISVKGNKGGGSILEKTLILGSPEVSITENDTESPNPPKQWARAGPMSSKTKRTSLKNSDQSNKVPDSNKVSDLESKLKNSNVTNLESEGSSSVQNENNKNSKRKLPNISTRDNDSESSLVNGVLNTEHSSLVTPENTIPRRRRPRKSVNTTEEESSSKSVRTRGKKIRNYSELISPDDSDDCDYAPSRRNSDTDYEPDEPKNSFKKKEDTPKKNEKPVDVAFGKPNEIKAVSNENIELEKVNLEPGNSSSNNKSITEEGLENKNNPLVEESKDVESTNDSSCNGSNKNEEEEEYTCSACNIRFTSIYEHIKQYHNGQEVVVEVPEEEIKEDLKVYQESSKTLVSVGDPEQLADTPAVKADATAKYEKEDNQSTTKKVDKKKKDITGFAAEGGSSDLVYTRTFKKVKKDDGEHWVQLQSENKKIYQFVRDENKYQKLMTELRNNTSIHPELNMPVNKLFESPKINVVEITYQPNSPYLIHKTVNFKNPMPMFIVDRVATNNPEVLGGIASYIMAGKGTSCSSSSTAENHKVIGVMKVILASDNELTVENIVFMDKPANPDMVPVLEDVKTPDIPMLKDAKILKWRCNKCLATTWKFPLHKETHYCNACPICHKTFISPVSLKKHLVLHKRDGTKYCKECQATFVSKVTLNSHLGVHITHCLCDKCHLFVLRDKIDEHKEIHSKDPAEQFPCSVCKKVFGSGEDLNNHETKLCSKLVAKFNCPQCDKKFFSSTALSYHTAAHNKAAIKLNCRFCPKVFLKEKEQCPKRAGKRKPSSYIQKMWHERIHTRDRPYLCKSCPKRFRSMEQEVQHNAKVHTLDNATPLRNIHVHMCTYCDRVFRSEKQLTSHMTLHTADDE